MATAIMPPKAFTTYKRKRSTKGRSVKGTYARRRSVKHTAYRKKAYRAKRSYKRTRRSTKGGLPHSRVRTMGSYSRVRQSSKAPRKGHFQLSQRIEFLDVIPTATTAIGAISNFFIQTNNIGLDSFAAAGDNYRSLVASAAVESASYLPRGVNEDVWNQFYHAVVIGTAIKLRFQRSAQSQNPSDYRAYIALTPLDYDQWYATHVDTGATLYAKPTDTWKGTTASDQWNTCINTPGTVYRELGAIASPQMSVTLHGKKNMNYFITEPLWQANLQYQNFVTGRPNLVNGYQAWWCVTYYQPEGFATAVPCHMSVTMDQRWFVKAYDPVPATLITEADEAVEQLRSSLITDRSREYNELKEAKEAKSAIEDDDDPMSMADFDVALPMSPTPSVKRSAAAPPAPKRPAPAAPAKRA